LRGVHVGKNKLLRLYRRLLVGRNEVILVIRVLKVRNISLKIYLPGLVLLVDKDVTVHWVIAEVVIGS